MERQAESSRLKSREMETWAIVTIVLGTNIITNLLTWFLTNRQLAHSDKQLERQLETQREADQRNRRRDIRSQPLLKLREELACMAERFEGLVDFATQVIEGVSTNSGKIIKSREKALIERFEKAAKEWDAYYYSGRFHQALHMQYNYDLKREAHGIFFDYQLAYLGLAPFFEGGEADEKVREAKDVIRINTARISKVQSKINELLEEL